MAYNEQLWQDAKKKCRLTDDDIARAKRLGLNPRSLILLRIFPAKVSRGKRRSACGFVKWKKSVTGRPLGARPEKHSHNPSISFAIWSADFTNPTSTSRLNMTSPK